jgi:hypothetical protein
MPMIDNKMLTNCRDLICVLKFCFRKKENMCATTYYSTYLYEVFDGVIYVVGYNNSLTNSS